MQNFIQSGKVLSLVAPAGGVLSGEFVVVGGLHGFAITDAAEGAIVSVSREGVFSAPKAGVEIHQGDPLFWDAGNKVFTTVVQDDPIRAVAAEDAGAEAESVPVVLVTPIEQGGPGEGYEPDGTTIDLVADRLHVKAGGHTHSGGEVTTAVAEATHAASADTANTATSAGDADMLDGLHSSSFAASGHDHDGDYAPLTHASRHATGGGDALAPADIGAMPLGPTGIEGHYAQFNADGTLRDGGEPGGGGDGGPALVDVAVAMGETTGSSAPAPEHVGWAALAVLPAGADVGVANVVVNVDGSVTVTTLAASTAGSAFKVCLISMPT